MLYILIGVVLFGLLVWAGRRARPLLQKRELRILTAVIGAMVMAGGAFTALRGGYVMGAILASLGAGLVFTGRGGVAGATTPSRDDPAVADAREILGVGEGASREEIQAAYGRLIRAVHPDVGGTSGLAARLNAARDTLLKK
ncbi:MAG: molecular chaperone DnaJ [Caulobacter sp.]|nr:molecular chaperone DnaJ [Caulobacter sp.]